jgi:phosphonate transport system substrate-binding protein
LISGKGVLKSGYEIDTQSHYWDFRLRALFPVTGVLRQAAADKLAVRLSEKTGKKIEVLIPTTYATAVQGLISKKVHVAYMDSLPSLIAAKETQIEILAVEKRNEKTHYDSLIVVPLDSPAKTLRDLKGKRFAFTSQTSTSGYLFPYSRLVQDKLVSRGGAVDGFLGAVTYAGGYDKALRAVIQGQADAAAFSDYVLEGPKADLYGTAQDRAKVRVLTRTEGVPTHLIAASKDLSPALRNKIKEALLGLAKEDSDLLSSVYGAPELVAPPTNAESHVARTVQALKDTGLDAKVFVK